MLNANVRLNNITPPRVPLTDPRTGLIAREWYLFLLNLFTLVGGGQNTTSLTDLQVGPPPVGIDELENRLPSEHGVNPDDGALLAQVSELDKRLQALEASLGHMSLLAELDKRVQSQEVLPTRPESILTQMVDVQAPDLVAGDLLQYNGSIARWVNKPAESVITAASAIAPSVVTVTASPFVFQNTNAYNTDLIVGGTVGGVTDLEFSRDGTTWYSTGNFYGVFPLSPNDSLRITYTSAPTVVAVPR